MKTVRPLVLMAFLLVAADVASAAPVCKEPNVLVVFDVSGSMGKASDPASKYTQATTALVNSTSSLDDQLRFGLLMFPRPDGSGCSIATTPQIGFALNNGPLFDDLLLPGGATFWGGPTALHDTPMFQALTAAKAVPNLQTADRRGFVLLITDGSQDCCVSGDYDGEDDCLPDSTTLDPTEGAENVQDIVGVITTLADSGIRTFVVGFGTKVNAAGLNKMAVAGTTAKAGCNSNQTDGTASDNCYYNAADGTGLTSALAAVGISIKDESCDGLDNDCDGLVDEVFPTLGQACDSGDSDKCTDGELVCSGDTKSVICEENGFGNIELCDGQDNDCDGQTDEGFPGVGTACDGDDGDVCKTGEIVCTFGGFASECDETGLGSVELCDGEDNDCDGQADEGFPGIGETCDGPDADECTGGFLVCAPSGKSTDCDEEPGASNIEGCNGADDDCDGETDEGDDLELCGESRRCLNGVCVGDQIDQPGDLEEADTWSAPDAEDNPLPGTDTSGATDQPGDAGNTPSDQAGDVQPGLADTGIMVPDYGPSGNGGAGARYATPVLPPADSGGCGCRTTEPPPALPVGPGIVLCLVLVWAARRRA